MYIYDALHHLKKANYSNNDYYHYEYDAVGNRETQQKSILGFVTNDSYVYDDANRLTSVNAVNYSWDNNGNLLNDGVNTYTYDTANRLKTLSGQGNNVTYAYNGLGDRLRETVNGNPTTFTTDLNAGLTQALSDGTKEYIYGNGRILQAAGTGTEYFLGDGLGSVRQLTNASGTLTYAKAYDPYGVVTTTSGASQTAYGYTNEYTSQGLVYLRARYYSPQSGRFLTRDTWKGNYNRPLSLNRWGYVEANPANYTDPTGLIKQGAEAAAADKIVKELKVYKVFVKVDWGMVYFQSSYINQLGVPFSTCVWTDGEWSVFELTELRKGTVDLSRAMGGLNKFIYNIGYVNVLKGKPKPPNEDMIAVTVPHLIKVNNKYHKLFDRWSAVHELAHAWDENFGRNLSKGMAETILQVDPHTTPTTCDTDKRKPGCNDAGYVYGGVPPAGAGANFDRLEDFAESVTAYVYPNEAQDKVEQYFGDPDYGDLLYYADYRTTLRWLYIHTLIQTTKSHQQR